MDHFMENLEHAIEILLPGVLPHHEAAPNDAHPGAHPSHDPLHPDSLHPAHPSLHPNDPFAPSGSAYDPAGSAAHSPSEAAWGLAGNHVPDAHGISDPHSADGHSHPDAPHTHEEARLGGYYNGDGTYHYNSDNTDRDPNTGAIVRRN